MKGFTTACGDAIHFYEKSIIISFKGPRNVLSTSPLNGGYQENLQTVFNYDEKPNTGDYCQLRAATYEEHLRLIAAELDLDSGRTTGISTAASMKNAAVALETDHKLCVSAISTAGVEVDSGRAGDPAVYDEQQQQRQMQGTINIILAINAHLPSFAMTRALVTCTEAKTVALQELLVGSNYSEGLATGTGTDGVIIISNPESRIYLTDAGKHSKLGELIGRSVIKAVKEGLYRETELSPARQHSMLGRLKRYGVDVNFFWREYLQWMAQGPKNSVYLGKEGFFNRLAALNRQDKIVAATSLYIHLLDQYRWNMLNSGEVIEMAAVILKDLSKYLGIKDVGLPLQQQDQNIDREIMAAFAKVIVMKISNLC